VREIPFTIVRGFVMGAADVVPGVSGGTVALVFGIYHRLIEAVRTGSTALGRFVKFDFRGGIEALRRVEWSFFLPLVIGIGLAILTLSGIIETLLEDAPVQMSGLFLGLIAGSVVVAWQLLRTRDAARLGVLAAVGILTFVLLGLKEGTSEETVAQTADPALWAFFGAGAIAICAMILPGISGSFILVTMGMYGPVLGAVNDRDLAAVAAVAVGCVVGLALFSQVLHWALSEHYDTVMAALIGLMLGSLRVLWPWPDGVDSTGLGAPSDPVLVPVLLAVGGLVVVVAINAIGNRLEHRTISDEADEIRAT
jgi:putative membrane protein